LVVAHIRERIINIRVKSAQSDIPSVLLVVFEFLIVVDERSFVNYFWRQCSVIDVSGEAEDFLLLTLQTQFGWNYGQFFFFY